MPEYLTRDDVHMRLDNTACMYGKKWYYMRTAEREAVADFHVMAGYELGKPARNPVMIDVRDKDFCCKSPVLGYMNYGGETYYISRIPDRRQKQGLNQQSLISTNGWGPGGNYINTAEFKDMLVGKYPKQDAALATVLVDQEEPGNERVNNSVAFHRNFCYRKLGGNAIGMMYKERLVALYDKDTERFQLIQNKETSFMERILDKNGVTL